MLNHAIRYGHIGAVRILRSAGVDIDAPTPGGLTALHTAAMGNCAAIIELLLENGMDVMATEDHPNIQAALHLAARNGSNEAARVLLQNGADLSRMSSPVGALLHYAVDARSTPMVEILLELDATFTSVMSTIKQRSAVRHHVLEIRVRKQ